MNFQLCGIPQGRYKSSSDVSTIKKDKITAILRKTKSLTLTIYMLCDGAKEPQINKQHPKCKDSQGSKDLHRLTGMIFLVTLKWCLQITYIFQAKPPTYFCVKMASLVAVMSSLFYPNVF
jgi:hypothetical protein